MVHNLELPVCSQVYLGETQALTSGMQRCGFLGYYQNGISAANPDSFRHVTTVALPVVDRCHRSHRSARLPDGVGEPIANACPSHIEKCRATVPAHELKTQVNSCRRLSHQIQEKTHTQVTQGVA